MLQLSMYYGFRFRFCNVRSGNEKPHVERAVEVVRRKIFAFRDTFDTLEEANAYLLEVCEKLNRKPQATRDGKSAVTCLEEERPYLLPPMPFFDASRIVYARVDKYAAIVVDQNHYSVQDHLVGQLARVKVYSDRIQCFHSFMAIVVPKDNMLRQINDLVDFSFVQEELQNKYYLDNGRNAVPAT